MSDILETTEDGRFRIVLEHDTDAGVPDGDVYGYVMRRTWEGGRYVWSCESAPYGDTAGGTLADRMTTAENYGETYGADGSDAVDRAMMRAGAVDWHDFRSCVDRSGDDWRIIVTRDHLSLWGVSEDDADHPAREASGDWQAWLDSDVYGYVIEERAHWTTSNTFAGPRELETWETVDYADGSLWGMYGRDYAETVAREAWGEFLDTVTVAELAGA